MTTDSNDDEISPALRKYIRDQVDEASEKLDALEKAAVDLPVVRAELAEAEKELRRLREIKPAEIRCGACGYKFPAHIEGLKP